MDVCRLYMDKYLLAMVFTYFIRANLPHRKYNRWNFFAALYLAHDMEEDNEDLKYEIFPYALGKRWKENYRSLLQTRDEIFWKINCRAVVSKRCCDQAMRLEPSHSIWKRERAEHHSYCIKPPHLPAMPRGPFSSPLCCRDCLEKRCLESNDSYLVYTSPDTLTTDSIPESPQETGRKDSGFESFLTRSKDSDIRYQPLFKKSRISSFKGSLPSFVSQEKFDRTEDNACTRPVTLGFSLSKSDNIGNLVKNLPTNLNGHLIKKNSIRAKQINGPPN